MSEYCGSCGAKPLPGARFCWKCGASVAPPETPPEPAQPAASSPPTLSVCPSCGAQLLPDARFCAECGASVPASQAPPEPALPPAPKPPAANQCLSCGATLQPGAQFCNQCGHALAKPPAAEPAPTAAPVDARGEDDEEKTVELRRPPVQPAARAPARPRPEPYERRPISRAVPLEQPKRWWLTALVALAVVAVAVGGAGAAAFFLGLGPLGSSDDGEVQTVELVASNMKFSPSEIRVQSGRDVRVHFVNNDTGVRHQLVFLGDDPLDSKAVIGDVVEGPGEDSITFSPPPGRYVFWCGLHPDMQGTLIVAGQEATSTPSRTATSTATSIATPPASPTVTPTPKPLSIRYAIAAHVWPDPLNVRPDPSTKNKELLQVNEGDRVEAISGPTYNDGRNWWKVSLSDGREGYMAEEFLFLSYATVHVDEEDAATSAILTLRDVDVLRDGSLLVGLSFTNVSGTTLSWTSDTGNSNTYLTDESGNRYSSLEVGGAFSADLAQGLKANETLAGWHRFSAPPELLDRLSTGTLESMGPLTLHYPNHGPIEFSLR